MKAEMLDPDTEYRLASEWRNDQNEDALHRLINAYMRLAISMASKYRRYNVSQQDLIQEAGMGLMKAAQKFDPDKGVRFSTYAQWWIKASIQDFVMRNYSMVRTGSTTNQKSLFFNLARVKNQLERDAVQQKQSLTPQQILEQVSSELGVPMRDVEMMNGRMAGSDMSLNAVQSSDDEGREWIETLADEAPSGAEQVEESFDNSKLEKWVGHAMRVLTDRERYIVEQRRMIDDERTLESIGNELNLSKERIRQIEAGALQKLEKRMGADGHKVAKLMINA
jgi:RNA polymerase sigma-32 factor